MSELSSVTVCIKMIFISSFKVQMAAVSVVPAILDFLSDEVRSGINVENEVKLNLDKNEIKLGVLPKNPISVFLTTNRQLQHPCQFSFTDSAHLSNCSNPSSSSH